MVVIPLTLSNTIPCNNITGGVTVPWSVGQVVDRLGYSMVLLYYLVAVWQMDYTCLIILLINDFPKITFGLGSAYVDQINRQSYILRYS